MTTFDPVSCAGRLDAVAVELSSALRLDDWWGPARNAFDAEVTALRDEALSISADVQSSP